MATLKKTMFREYDIRGREESDELNDESVYHIARGFARMLNDKGVMNVIVGNDARSTSESFSKQAIRAFTEAGIDVTNIGTVTTPMSYWAQYFLRVRGLCMITASHNPVGWNGLKLGYGLSKTLLLEEIQELYNIIRKEDYVTAEKPGTVTTVDIHKEYFADLIKRSTCHKKLRVLVNTGNGTAGMYAPELLREAGYEVVEHNTNVDPTYPNYTANPDGEKMMQDTGAQTIANTCNIGIALDGDGDRLGMTDEKGATVWPDRYLILLSRLVLKQEPGAKIVFDVKVSEALPEDIAAHGGKPIMWKTGHSYIKAKMHEEKAALAGEMSGHMFFAQNFYGFDDALFAMLKMLEYVGSQDKPVSDLVADTPYYVSTPTIQVQTTDERKYVIVAQLTKSFEDDGYKVVTINGARVYTDYGWGLVRASSNTPSLVLRFESKTKEDLEKIETLFKAKLRIAGVLHAWDSSGH